MVKAQILTKKLLNSIFYFLLLISRWILDGCVYDLEKAAEPKNDLQIPDGMLRYYGRSKRLGWHGPLQELR